MAYLRYFVVVMKAVQESRGKSDTYHILGNGKLGIEKKK